MEKRDYYEILNIKKDSSQAEIKKAYRKLVKQYHPDVNKEDGAEDKFKEVQEAYEVLSDDSKRSAYDQYGHAATAGFNPGAGGYSDFNGYGGNTPFDMGDIFNTFFGGNQDFGFNFSGFGNERDVREEKGSDLRYRIRLSFEESMKGGSYDINIKKDEQCTECDGSGSKSGKLETCPVCKGSGKERQVRNTMLGQIAVMSTCSRCKGAGKIVDDPCSKCRGTGVKLKEEKVSIHIPAGAYDGMVLRFRGGGNAGRQGSIVGDLYVEIEVEASKIFERREYDLYSEEKISPATAVLGGIISVDSIDGKVKLKIPNGTQSDTIFKIKDSGVPVLGREGERGDLYVKVNVVIPKKISKKEKELWEELKEL